MPEEISCDLEKRIIKVKSTGHVPVSEWYDSLIAVMHLNSKHGIDRMLVDATQQTGTSDRKEIAKFSESIPKVLKIALLVKPLSDPSTPTTEPKMRFLEVAARINGVVIQSFVEEAKAVNWLIRPSTSESS